MWKLLFLWQLLEPVRYWTPGSIAWQRVEADGSKYAVLEGSRDEPGKPFTYAFLLPDGQWVKGHTHTQAARVVVVSGTLLLGEGPRLDRGKVREVKAGEVFYVPANVPHFEGARGDTLIIGFAIGNWKTQNLE
ncbi:MAG: cupin domain-containing protein [Bryobacteraceae bacterium]|nr:cupin domain-containing protein [Bryobacteraceae bacterium]